MSARPRPVTATFRPKSMAPPAVGIRTWTYSTSSASSLESLISVLDHDSYESLSDVSDDVTNDVAVEPCCKASLVGSSQSKALKAFVTAKAEAILTDGKHKYKKDWKEWMVDKARQLRMKRKCEDIRSQRQAEEELRKQKEKEERLTVIERKTKEWMKAKQLAEASRKEMEVRPDEKREKEVSRHNEEAYRRWTEQKERKEKEKKIKEGRQKKAEQHERERKERRSTEAYEGWLRKARDRPKSAHSSLGYCNGKLTGYYDTCTYPTPSFINPLPWKPIEIPKQKSVKKRPISAPKKRWNPERYF